MSQETRGGPGLIQESHATLHTATGSQVPGVHMHPQERGGQDQEPGPMRN